MANRYAQMNPGLWHTGYRFPSPALIDRLDQNVMEENRLELRYKSSVVANRSLYVGNVEVIDRNGVIRVEGDSMYKSIPNKFDSFSKFSKLEVTQNDGQNIIALALYGDILLQFKEEVLYLIDVASQYERVVAKKAHRGIPHIASFCYTDFGIPWANQHGCFMFDGKQITNLLERKGLQKIKEGTWQGFIKTPMVGYYPRKRQLIVVDDIADAGDGSMYLYDFVTGSWIRGIAGTYANAVKSNFVHDWNGDLIHATSLTTKIWDDAPAIGAPVIITKDIDFGNPSSKKNVYKVYISYKGDGSAITCRYSVNGDTDTYGNFFKIGVTGATTGAASSTTPFYGSSVGTDDWVRAELQPASNIRNIYSLALVFGGTSAADFEINDITIVYREKVIL